MRVACVVAALRATAGVDRVVPDAEIGQPCRIVSSGREVRGDVGHVVVDAGIPAYIEHSNLFIADQPILC